MKIRAPVTDLPTDVGEVSRSWWCTNKRLPKEEFVAGQSNMYMTVDQPRAAIAAFFLFITNS